MKKQTTPNPAIGINAAWGTNWAQLPQVEVQNRFTGKWTVIQFITDEAAQAYAANVIIGGDIAKVIKGYSL